MPVTVAFGTGLPGDSRWGSADLAPCPPPPMPLWTVLDDRVALCRREKAPGTAGYRGSRCTRWCQALKRSDFTAATLALVTVTIEQIRHTGRVPAEAAEAIADVIATDLDHPIEPDEHGQWPTGWLAADMAALDLVKAVLAHAPAAA